MATGILGLGQGQAASLNSDMLEKLKAVDRKAYVEPIEKKLEKFSSEKEVISKIGTKVDELLSAVKIFSLNQTTGVNAFNQKSANVMGEGVVFDAPDLNALKNGSLSVKVKQLAQKDVWQSNSFNVSKDALVNQGTLKINGKDIDTTNLTYNQLVSEINKIDGVKAALVDNSAGKFRLSIKTEKTGIENKIKFSDSDTGVLSHFGFDNVANNVLKAQDMLIKVDGVEYNSSNNSVTVDGLKITGTKTGAESTINIQNDTSSLTKNMQNFATKYNELRAEIENEIYSTESSIYNKSSLRNMLDSIKNQIFGKGSGEQSIFSFGFSLSDKTGDLVFNAKQFEDATKNGTKELEKLFAGTPDKKGIATTIDEKITISGVKKGLIDYELDMLSREEATKKEKTEAENTLENRYSSLAQQFAAYGVLINQMEASFSGLKMLIMQSVASK